MSGLAKLSLRQGALVLGSDISTNEEVGKLKDLGVKIHPNHSESNITPDIDLVVYSGAIKSDNPEIVKAKELGIEVIERSEFLGFISSKYKNVIAISGTHGKTTTTSIIGLIFKNANINPTVHLGGNSIDLGGNTILGGNDFFIVEACEYRESFLYLNPTISVITNIESDHLDYYKSYDNLYNAFQKFANNSDAIVIDKKEKIEHINTIKIGVDYKLKNVKFADGGYNFDVYKDNKKWLQLRLNVLGKYNVVNALYAVIVADYYDIDKEIIIKSLNGYRGVERRNEIIGEINSTPIIVDYAHHPTEIKCSVNGISEVYNKVLYIFQPHTYSRTLTLMKDFVKTLKELNHLIIFKSYSAREDEIIGGRAKDLHLHLPNSFYAENVNDIIDYIKDYSYTFDCIVILGAGDLAIDIKNILNKPK